MNLLTYLLGLHSVAHELLISHLVEGMGRLSWPEHVIGYQLACSRLFITTNDPGEIQIGDLKVTSPILYH